MNPKNAMQLFKDVVDSKTVMMILAHVYIDGDVARAIDSDLHPPGKWRLALRAHHAM